jgi:CheY-like chemotaxis protein
MVERVLVVDDDPVQRRLVENIVGKAGYETAAVDGGEAALKVMLATASTPYDCVVLDLVMPDLDGLGVLVRMREAQIAAEIGDFDRGDQRTSAKTHAMLAPIDDVGARQLCESHMGRSATEVPLLPGDGDSAEHLVMPAMLAMEVPR